MSQGIATPGSEAQQPTYGLIEDTAADRDLKARG